VAFLFVRRAAMVSGAKTSVTLCRHHKTGHATQPQCSTDVRRRLALRSDILAAAVCLVIASCTTTTYYARRPETDRSSYLAAGRLAPRMTLVDVVVVMLDARLGGQYVSLASGAKCPAVSTKLILHAGELLATVGGTRISAGGFASIEIYRRDDASLSTFGFERQGAFREAVLARQKELLVCDEALLSFDSTVEGGCGQETILLTFDADGVVSSVGSVTSETCAP